MFAVSMGGTVIERLARRLRRCPFDQELFDRTNSALQLRLHLREAHSNEICPTHRIARLSSSEPEERPTKLYCCRDCDFATPYFTEVVSHIQTEHPDPRGGPAHIGFRISEDETVIDTFMERRESVDV